MVVSCSESESVQLRSAADGGRSGFELLENQQPTEWTTARKIVETQRIGQREGRGPAVFGRVVGFAVDSQGSIAVLDGMEKNVKLFDKTGAHIKTFGRDGSGPGEFETPAGILQDRTGRFWIVDPGNNRYTVFDADGAYVETRRRHRFINGMVFPWRGVFDQRNRLIDVGLHTYLGDGVTPLSRGPVHSRQFREGFSRYSFVRYGLDDEVIDTFAVHEDHYLLLRNSVRAPSSRATFTLDPRGFVWFTDSSSYKIFKRTFDGDTVLAFTGTHTPVEFTKSERDSIAQVYGMRDASDMGLTNKAAVSRIILDDGGRVVAQRAAYSGDDRTVFDVFSPDGVYAGEVVYDGVLVTNPAPIFKGNLVYGWTTDEWQVLYLVIGYIATSTNGG
jgi:hypothetical protein